MTIHHHHEEESAFVSLLGDQLLTQLAADQNGEKPSFLKWQKDNLHSHHGPTAPTDDILEDKDFVLLYFSAAWCPPCQRFSPLLKQFYKTVNETETINATIEVVYIGSDRDSAEFVEYYGTMPWLALENQHHKTHATQKCHVQGIPSLVVLDGQGRFVTDQGKTEVEHVGGHKNQAKALIEAWKKQEAVHLEEAQFSHIAPLCSIL